MKGKIWMLVGVILTAGILVGCDAETEERTDRYIMPQELADKGCKIFRMDGEKSDRLNVVYCPGAETTTQYPVGKARQSVTVIDEGKDYGY